LQLRGHAIVCSQNDENHCEFCSQRIITGTESKAGHEATCKANPSLWCDFCGSRFPHKILRDKHLHSCAKHPNLICKFCGDRFSSRLQTVLHQITCTSIDNPLHRMLILTECVCCCEVRQCMRFPCRMHHYCATCVFRMARSGIKDRTQLPLRCCKTHVEAGSPVDLAVVQILSEVDREKYQEAMLLKTAKHLMYCPQPDCGALIGLDEVVRAGATPEGPGGCPKCQQSLCYECKSEWHVGMSCQQYQWVAGKHKDAITQLCKDNQWMR
jgi:hypothetical protein